MTKTQLKAIDKAIGTVEELYAQLEALQTECQDAIDEKSDKWREGEKGEAAQEQLNHVEEAMGELERVKDSLFEAKGEA